MRAQGQYCRVQRNNPAPAQGQSCVRKSCRKPCWGRDASMDLSCISAPALTPGSLPELCCCVTSLPLPAHILRWSWPPAWPWSCSIPTAVVTIPSSALFATCGAVGWGHGERSLPWSAPLLPFLPIAKALLAWRGIHNSCIKSPCNSFYSVFHCKNNSQLESKRKNVSVMISLITGVAAVLWVHGTSKGLFLYLHVCISYKWSNCMDVRISVCIYICVYRYICLSLQEINLVPWRMCCPNGPRLIYADILS